jgi:hypothetical protein
MVFVIDFICINRFKYKCVKNEKARLYLQLQNKKLINHKSSRILRLFSYNLRFSADNIGKGCVINFEKVFKF